MAQNGSDHGNAGQPVQPHYPELPSTSPPYEVTLIAEGSATMNDEQRKGLLLLGITAVSGIVAVVLFVVTPLIPDEALPGVLALGTAIFGVKKLVSGKNNIG